MLSALARTPQQAVVVSATVHGTLAGSIDWYARGDFSGSDEQFVQSDNVSWLPARRILNARIGVGGRRWEVAIWGENLTDQRYPTSVIVRAQLDVPYSFDVTQSNGRRVGITTSYHVQ